MTTVVISQPMFFPWVGLFEQIRLADVHIHYDDVQFSKGSFTNRVQIKTADGFKWLTIPVADHELHTPIKDIEIKQQNDWRASHLAFLKQTYRAAPHAADMLGLIETVYRNVPGPNLCELVMASMHAVMDYFELAPRTRFERSSGLAIGGKGSERVLAVVKAMGGDLYVTGHGARHYLDHEAFERDGVGVAYMDYRKAAYPQLYGDFNPYVSILDLVANLGRAGRDMIHSPTKPWRAMLNE